MLGGINFPQNFPGNNPVMTPGSKTKDSSPPPEVNQKAPPEPKAPVPSGQDVKTMGEMRNNHQSGSDPVKSHGVTQIQGEMAKEVTGTSAPYNRFTLSNGRHIDVNIDDANYKSMPGMTQEQIEEGKKRFIGENREKMTKFLSEQEGNLPKDMKNINLTPNHVNLPFGDPTQRPQYNDMNYDPKKQTLNFPVDRLQKENSELGKELKDATNPELYKQRERLEGLGIKWVDAHNKLSGEQEIEIMKTLGDTASKVTPEKRPKDLLVAAVERDIPQVIGGMGFGGGGEIRGGTALGKYNNVTNHIEVMRKDSRGNDLSINEMKDNLVHEYGHAISDTNKKDERATGPVKPDILSPMTDSQGRNLTDRATALEESVKKQGHKPDDPANDTTVYDKYDPYVDTHSVRDQDGNIVLEKYTRDNKDEHYAETFREYVRNPERFKGRLTEMEEEMKKHKEGSPEYNYLKESLDIRRESYNYFKNNIFGGNEFGK